MGKSGSIANLVWLLAPPVLGIPVGYFVFLMKYHPADLLPVIAFACCLGFVMLVLSKVSAMRAGKLVTWGTREMKPRDRFFYRIGYLLIVLGVALLLAMFVRL